MTFEVYRITHRESGKAYIGCSKRGAAFRWRAHVYAANDIKRSFILHRAIAKYGVDSFDVETVAVAKSAEEMLALERQWISKCNTISPGGYNLTSGGDGMRDPSSETLEKLRHNSLGNKHFLGRKHSKETKVRMSVSAVRSPEHRAAISRAQKGKSVSDETRDRISASKAGKPHIGVKPTEEARMKMSVSRTGKRATAETKAKMSAARMGNQYSKGRVLSPEIRAKISASMKAVCEKRVAQRSLI